MNERLKEIRKAKNLSMEKFGELIGMSKAQMSRLENGSNNFVDRTIKIICKTYKVNEEWFRTGVGDMFVDQSKEEWLSDLTVDILKSEDNDFKTSLFKALASLTPDQWALLEEISNKIIENKKED